MEYQKITHLLGNIPDKVPRFVEVDMEVCDQSGATEDRYKPSKQIRFKTSMLRPDLCDCSDAYIFVKGNTTVKVANNRDRKNRSLAFKDKVPFTACI